MLSRSAGDVKKILEGTLAAAAMLDIVLTNYLATYRGFLFVLSGWRPATDDVQLWMRLSTDGGASFGAASYVNKAAYVPGTGLGTSTAAIVVAGDDDAQRSPGNAATEHTDAEILLLNPTSAAFHQIVQSRGAFMDTFGTLQAAFNAGKLSAAQDTDAVRFLFESGNIAEGKYAMFGIK